MVQKCYSRQVKPYNWYIAAVTVNQGNYVYVTADNQEPRYLLPGTHRIEYMPTRNPFVLKCVSANDNYLFELIEYNMDKDFEGEHDTSTVRQIYINPILNLSFGHDIISRYGLTHYHNPREPSFFFGLLSDDDLHVLQKHKSTKIIIWIGGDINYDINRTEGQTKTLRKRLNSILQVPDLKHISISSFIGASLDKLKLSYKSVPFMGFDPNKYKPVAKGPCIYLYTSIGNEKYYGEDLYLQVMKRYPDIKFIITCCIVFKDKTPNTTKYPGHKIQYYPKDVLVNEIYPQCFVGLRLTDHDGLAGTVQELGLMGIKSIHNGSSPSSLNYKNIDDICDHIDRERESIGKIDTEMANAVYDYLTIPDEVFKTDYYE